MYKELIEERVGRKAVSKNFSKDATLGMLNAALKAYPLIVLANLTTNSYILVKNEGFLFHDLPESGRYDDMIDDGLDFIHEHYQRVFFGCFNRENLLERYERGQEEIYAEVYQRKKDGTYHWVCITAMRLQDEDNDDIIQLCLSRELPEQIERPFGRK